MRQNLRRALYNLRQTLEAPTTVPLLLVTPQDMQLNPQSDHWLDVAKFRALLAQAQGHSHLAAAASVTCHQHLAEAVALYRGDFLAGFSLPASEPFEEWRLFTQEALHVAMLDALTTLATFHQSRQEQAQTIAYLQRQIELEPWREEAHRALMRFFAERGDRSAALAQYTLCVRLLNEELGAPPSTETDELYEQILQGVIGKSQQKVASPVIVQTPVASQTILLPAPVTPFIGRLFLANRKVNDWRLKKSTLWFV
jgi:DNA-binding SARP family transcriptional activator